MQNFELYFAISFYQMKDRILQIKFESNKRISSDLYRTLVEITTNVGMKLTHLRTPVVPTLLVTMNLEHSTVNVLTVITISVWVRMQ